MHFIRSVFSLFFGLMLSTSSVFAAVDLNERSARVMSHIDALASSEGIGPRVAGSKEEKMAARYIHNQFQRLGIDVQIRPFEAIFRGQDKTKASQNVVAFVPGKSKQQFIIGAHYDSVPESTGSMGVIDNAASVALMIELANYINSKANTTYSFVFVAFGAEEVGLTGSRHFANHLSSAERANTVGMLNLDSITGGDKLYIHSALSKGYKCDQDNSKFLATAKWRDHFLNLARQLNLPFEKHPGNSDYPAGETGGWSDHAPFACVGIPIVNIEATNFSITGEDGKDGYSQTTHPNLWDCFDIKTNGACNTETEKRWGKIWHTRFDKLDVLNDEFPQRLERQLNHSFVLLEAFIDNE